MSSIGHGLEVLDLGPEATILFRCARLDLDAAGRGGLRQQLGGKLDWELLLSLAAMHGLRPLLFRHVRAIAPEAVPKAIYAELWGHQEQLRRRNQAMVEELAALLRLFADKGIPAVPYKGPTLAMIAYGDLALREFDDLDVLVCAGDVFAASRLVQAEGYRPLFEIAKDDERRFIDSRRQYDLALYHDTRKVHVELHWRTDREFFVEETSAQAWWANLSSVDLPMSVLPTLPVAELFFALCIHGMKHGWDRVAWLVDISLLAAKLSVADWQWLVDTCVRLCCRTRVAVGLKLAADLLEAPVPEKVFRDLGNEQKVRRTALAIARRLPGHDLRRPGVLRQQLQDIGIYDNAGQRLARCYDLVFTPNAVDWSDEAGGGGNRYIAMWRRARRLGSKYFFGQHRQ